MGIKEVSLKRIEHPVCGVQFMTFKGLFKNF